MRALQLLGERQVRVIDKPEPRPGSGQVVVQMKAAAICGSDLHGYRHAQPEDSVIRRFVPGHEPCGVVAEVGPDVRGWSVGDRVVVYHRVTCMACHYCTYGFRNLCPDRKGAYGFNPDGADEPYMVANAHDLLPLPDDFSFLDGALFACQVGTAYNPLKMLGVGGRDNVVVSGLGPVGLLAVLLGKAMGARIIGVDPTPERRALAEKLGADAVLDPAAGSVGDAVGALCPGGADKLVETSGVPAAHATIVGQLRPNGQAAIVGLGTPEPSLNLAQLMYKQISIVGSNLYPDSDYREILSFVRQKRVPVADVVTHQMSIEEGPAAFQLADSTRGGKVVFRFD